TAGSSASTTTTPAADGPVDAGQPVASSAPPAPRSTRVAAPRVSVAAPRRLPPAPRYTHLTIQVDTDADWMTASLAGVRLISARVTQVSSGAIAGTTQLGITVKRRSLPLAGSGDASQSASADFVFQVADGSSPTRQV